MIGIENTSEPIDTSVIHTLNKIELFRQLMSTCYVQEIYSVNKTNNILA